MSRFDSSKRKPNSGRQSTKTTAGASRNPEGGLGRRSFLRLVGIGTLASLGGQLPTLAGSLKDPAFDATIPADKKLKPDRVKALFERGVPEVFRKDQLRNIAMPISGICTGQELNLSGEGALVGWRVHQCSIDIAQGFALRVTTNGKTAAHLLNQRDFPDLAFRGEYPIARVDYVNAAIPVHVSLEAFSPFIPLNTDDSGLPATIFHFTLKNTSATAIEATLAGSWENGICAYSRFNVCGTRHNRIVRDAKMTVLNCTASPASVGAARPDIVFEDWTRGNVEGWTVEGTAFGHDGRIVVDRIFFSDVSGDGTPFDQLPDYGTMALALIGGTAEVAIAKGSVGFDGQSSHEAASPLSEPLIGTLGRTVRLRPGESAKVIFVLSEWFPNLELRQLGKVGRYYATQFTSAQAVVEYVAANLAGLADATRLWRDTWYDSTLPYWFLDRTFLNTSTLASGVCYRTAGGRFYAYEGAPAPNYEGTCTHVWQYAHSVARIFPALERETRERVDLGVAFDQASGVIGFRGEKGLAVDGQAGTILRFYREHQMSPDIAFLKRNWEKIRDAYKPLFALDANEDGILEGNQNNTLDCGWYGQIAWMSSMYVAALRAGEQMAREMGDDAFARRCKRIAENGTRNITSRLFNGEYFFNVIDPKNAECVNSGGGCHIDQVYGQSWAFQVGLPRVLPEKETRTALQSIWKYNFSPDAGAYVEKQKLPGRRFVSNGDAGMLMCTFPICGYEYHGPLGHIGFAPRLTPENFRAPFIAAEGWGTYAQTISEKKMQASVELKWGQLTLRSMCLTMDGAGKTPSVRATLAGTDIHTTCPLENGRVNLAFTGGITILKGQRLLLEIT
jgi:hypothetical protein